VDHENPVAERDGRQIARATVRRHHAQVGKQDPLRGAARD
jgi:hypothetical protein